MKSMKNLGLYKVFKYVNDLMGNLENLTSWQNLFIHKTNRIKEMVPSSHTIFKKF